MISLLLKVGKMVTDVDDKQLSNNKPTMNMLFQFQTALWEGPQPWAAQLGGVGTVSPHFWDQQGTGGGPMKLIFASMADSLYSVLYK